ncbi:hypothetical protein GF339_13890 [candidate division KSB3 bacterium]|uniref:Uncharacterized protein n=1 Tax=candidate division KSB3 bacterium TaxID=2044937 RepID=A0A9D5JXJ1_9BACT|nr:hypothetical protein [candidate division KSB3 bacterium]MBD3325672.1 hypothetical protein [candidate division KSB3 bacterium]
MAHQVVAVADGKVEKVLCKTCGGQHKYRPNPPKSRSKKRATPKKKKKQTRKSKDPAERWQEALADKDLSNPKPYSMSEVFEQNDIIDHQKFGQGLVTEIRAEGKMEVLFKEGPKLLVHAQDKENEHA